MKVETQKEQVVGSLPIKGGVYEITAKYYFDKAAEFPDIDIKMQFMNMWSWLNANKSRLKTKRGMNKFITGWLIRSREKNAPTGRKKIINCASGPYEIVGQDEGEIWS
ncbi:MAG: hypothetical protein CMI54_01625 [Parcubacteria group bacterium]|nr:hypothetical protein [Parcubacteria group bacterium]|tara:strand:+ start:24549 stop:24872 length:324 start_codon:yes stop_codon:yes gene_type:complete